MNNDNANVRHNKVLLIYTGGTIGMGRNPQTDALEPLNFEHLIANLPEFAYLKTEIDTYQFTPPIDSSDMSLRRWAQLVRIIHDSYDSYDGFVILHGTDTMAYTASALSFMMENLTKPVILTGSQLPIGQLRTDGKENLVTSIELASAYNDDGHAIVPEVCIYFSGRLLRGNRSTKEIQCLQLVQLSPPMRSRSGIQLPPPLYIKARLQQAHDSPLCHGSKCCGILAFPWSTGKHRSPCA